MTSWTYARLFLKDCNDKYIFTPICWCVRSSFWRNTQAKLTIWATRHFQKQANVASLVKYENIPSSEDGGWWAASLCFLFSLFQPVGTIFFPGLHHLCALPLPHSRVEVFLGGSFYSTSCPSVFMAASRGCPWSVTCGSQEVLHSWVLWDCNHQNEFLVDCTPLGHGTDNRLKHILSFFVCVKKAHLLVLEPWPKRQASDSAHIQRPMETLSGHTGWWMLSFHFLSTSPLLTPVSQKGVYTLV